MFTQSISLPNMHTITIPQAWNDLTRQHKRLLGIIAKRPALSDLLDKGFDRDYWFMLRLGGWIYATLNSADQDCIALTQHAIEQACIIQGGNGDEEIITSVRPYYEHSNHTLPKCYFGYAGKGLDRLTITLKPDDVARLGVAGYAVPDFRTAGEKPVRWVVHTLPTEGLREFRIVRIVPSIMKQSEE